MAKTAKKKVAKKAATSDHSETRAAVVRLLLRKNGASMQELIDAGHNQPAATALKLAENRGLKTRKAKEEGEVTRYYATGTPTEPTRGRATGTKRPAKKAVAKKAKKKVAKKRSAKKAEPVAEAAVAA